MIEVVQQRRECGMRGISSVGLKKKRGKVRVEPQRDLEFLMPPQTSWPFLVFGEGLTRPSLLTNGRTIRVARQIFSLSFYKARGLLCERTASPL